jgi:LPXTG cell wall anchor motif
MMRTRSARWLAVAAIVALSLVPTLAASATAAPTQTVDTFTIDASLVGLPTKCLSTITGEWSVGWNFSVTSAINGFSVTVKNASAGGLLLTSQAQRAVYPAGSARTISFTGSGTYFGKDTVTQTITYDLLVSDTAAPDGKLVSVAPLATAIPSPCTASPSIATTTTTISSTACSCTPVVTVRDPAATTTSLSNSSASTSSTSNATAIVLPGAVSPSSTVAVLADSAKPKALPRTGGNVRSLLATAGAFVIVGITLAALPRRRTSGASS